MCKFIYMHVWVSREVKSVSDSFELELAAFISIVNMSLIEQEALLTAKPTLCP